MSGTLEFMGIRLNRFTIPELIDEIKLCIAQQRILTVSFFAFDTVNIIGSNKTARDIFKILDIWLPEGISIIWTSWLFGSPMSMENRISGDILAPFLYSEVIRQRWSIYLLGGAPGVASAAACKLQKSFPGLRIAGTHHGFSHSEKEKQAVIDDINRSKAMIVQVGMGQPKQEEWIIANGNRVCARVLMAVGGYFNHLIRRIDCYPSWVYKWRINWAYRFFTEPKRLWKRYTFGILTFCTHVLCMKLKHFQNKS